MKALGRVVAYLLLAGAGLITAGPFLWTLITAMKGSGDVFRYPPELVPGRVTFENFARVWEIIPFKLYLLNSIFVALFAVLLNLTLASLSAYPLARIPFRGRRSVMMVILATMLVPEQVIMIPVYLILLKGGLLNTLAGVVLPFSVTAMGIFLMREQFREIPVELDEAARMDGASSFMIWRRILLPLSRPALATLGVFTFVGSWSGFLWPLIVLRDQELYTLPVGLNALLSGFSSDYRLLAAGAVIATIPVILLFLALQRFFIRGIQTSGLK